jgi:hypothetical protein
MCHPDVSVFSLVTAPDFDYVTDPGRNDEDTGNDPALVLLCRESCYSGSLLDEHKNIRPDCPWLTVGLQ